MPRMTQPRMLAATLALALAAAAGPARAAEPLYVTFETSMGKIGVKLLPGEAPKAVQNFVELAQGKKEWTDPKTGKKVQRPLYDGTLFHRVIPGFMIQGGDPSSQGAPLGATAGADGMPFGIRGPGYSFADELPQPPTRTFDKPCMLAMANSGPNTNGSQFFITEAAKPHLDPQPCPSDRTKTCGYTRFGEGVCGCDLVGPIARAGNAKVRLEKVVVSKTAPTCK
jgi:peptidylprolyl isomerase/peptidyl-prolyl cis-trans isomerase A (cyclophilin A)